MGKLSLTMEQSVKNAAEVVATTSVEDLPIAEEQAAKELALVNGTPNPKPPTPKKPPVVELGKRDTPTKSDDDEMEADALNQAPKLANT